MIRVRPGSSAQACERVYTFLFNSLFSQFFWEVKSMIENLNIFGSLLNDASVMPVTMGIKKKVAVKMTVMVVNHSLMRL